MEQSTYDQLIEQMDDDENRPEQDDQIALYLAARDREDLPVQIPLQFLLEDEELTDSSGSAIPFTDPYFELMLKVNPSDHKDLSNRMLSWCGYESTLMSFMWVAQTKEHLLPVIESLLSYWDPEWIGIGEEEMEELKEGISKPYHRLAKVICLYPGYSCALTGAAKDDLKYAFSLEVCAITGPEVASLASSDWNLKRLSLWPEDGHELEIGELSSATGLQHLTHLAISGSISEEVQADILVGPGLPSLTSFSGSHMAGPKVKFDLVRFANALNQRPLKRQPFAFCLPGGGYRAEDLAILLEQPAMQQLSGLSLSTVNYPKCDESDMSLVDTLSAAPLTINQLELVTGKMSGPEIGQSLARASWIHLLRQLRLFDAHIGDKVMAQLISQMKRISYLDLMWNELGSEFAAVMAKKDLSNLTHLILTHNQTLTDEDVALILANPSLTRLEVLEVLDAGALAARALLDSPAKQTLTKIHMSAPRAEGEMICRKHFPSLTSRNIQYKM